MSTTSLPVGKSNLRGKLPVRILGPHKVLKSGHGFVLELRSLPQAREPLAVLGVRSVGEVEPGDVHAGVDEGTQAVEGVASRTEGAD